MEYREMLEKAMKLLRCPICSVLEDLEFRHLSKLQYTVTHDNSIRVQLALLGGFCAFHFRKFGKIANAQTNALLLHAIFEDWKNQKRNTYGNNCMICQQNSENEEALLEAFALYFRNENFFTLFRSSAGLCFNHHFLISERLNNTNEIEKLIQLREEHIERLMNGVDTMIHTSYFQTRADERRAIPCMVEKLVGRTALRL
jgi:hypothetical protein